MTATPPSYYQIRELAEKRTVELGYPKDPPADGRNHRLYAEQRDALLARQVENAELRLTAAFEHERDREQQAQQRERNERAALEQQLKRAYQASAPGTTETDAERALPDLLHRHRLAQLDQHDADMATARARVARHF